MNDPLKTILLVDDDPDALEIEEFVVLEVADFRIVRAQDGESGLQKAREELPDLIILDVMMPKKDGFAVFGELRSAPETREIPVIMLTGVSRESGIEFSADAMAEYYGKKPDMFIDKPVDPEKLQQAVKRLLGL